jgi:REP-associated tyrosine transposase
MSRGRRNTPGGYIYHVLNRANARATIFEKNSDYAAFIDVVRESLLVVPIKILTYCVLPNHWHFVMWPEKDGQLSEFMHLLTTTHVCRWHAFHGTVGEGHLYQGPYKSFAVECDAHFFTLCRYVERNALRANIVDDAANWNWGGLWARNNNKSTRSLSLADWPLPQPMDWRQRVNMPLTLSELNAIRDCTRRGRPFGTPAWQKITAQALGLEHTLRTTGRPQGCADVPA